jgi:hypothetical protein
MDSETIQCVIHKNKEHGASSKKVEVWNHADLIGRRHGRMLTVISILGNWMVVTNLTVTGVRQEGG